MNTGIEPLFIVSYRTKEGTCFRTEVSAPSWRETRALYMLNSHIVPGTLVVQPVHIHSSNSGVFET